MRFPSSPVIAVALIVASAQGQLQLRDLSGLTLAPSGSLSPAFDVGTANYTATVAAEHVIVSCPVADHATVTLAVDGVPLGGRATEGASYTSIPQIRVDFFKNALFKLKSFFSTVVKYFIVGPFIKNAVLN